MLQGFAVETQGARWCDGVAAKAPDELLDAEIAMVQATIGQLEAELHFLAVERRQRAIKA